MPPMTVVGKEFKFEAAHVIPNHPGKCSRLHGHSYKAIVSVAGPIKVETGMVIDFDELTRVAKVVIDETLDHRNLNEVLNGTHVWDARHPEEYTLPTAENLAVYLFTEFKKGLAQAIDSGIRMCSVTVYETATSFATYSE